MYFTVLNLLFSRDYWKRILLAQELTVARDVLVLCGSGSTPLQVLIEALEVMKVDQGQRALALQPLEEDIWPHFKWKGPASIEASQAGFLSKKPTSYDAIQFHYQKLASNPRDKIFALMGLANDAELQTLKIDHSKSVAEIYHQFAICSITISLRIDLIMRVQHDDQSRFNLPSWVPDWTFNKRAHVRLQNIRPP